MDNTNYIEEYNKFVKPIDINENNNYNNYYNIIPKEEDIEETEDDILNVDIINIFFKYYKSLYPDKIFQHIFINMDIDNIIETNEPMELFYYLSNEYNDCYITDKDKTKAYKYDKLLDKELIKFGLYINNKLEYVAKYVFTLLLCVVDKFQDNDWKIVKI